MIRPPDGREHFNLYYIFAEDKASHPPDEKAIESLRRQLIEAFKKKKS